MTTFHAPVTKDTFTSLAEPDTNFSADSSLEYGSGGSRWCKRIYIEFDAAGMTAVTSAKLKLYLHSADEGPKAAGIFRRITDNTWAENEVTWNDPPLTTTVGNLGKLLSKEVGWHEFDITKIVKKAVSIGDRVGIELWANPANESPLKQYDSNNATNTPQLTIEATSTTPTISSISWSPDGDFKTLATGAMLAGPTNYLKLISTNPDAPEEPERGEGTALLQIVDAEFEPISDPFTAEEGDYFQFDDATWHVLNIVCGPECSFITLADADAEAERTPKIGDEVTFAAMIDWHDEEVNSIKWYYGKPPNECFTADDVDWTLFSDEKTDMPSFTFENDDDHEIVFLKVIATNIAGGVGEFGTCCEPIFNLWLATPSWYDPLLESIRTANAAITKPITDLFPPVELPAWTTPPFTCPICEQVFDAEDSELDYANHLMSHITAFQEAWFEQ